MKLKDKFLKWYNNYPLEGVEITESSYKFIKTDDKFNILKNELWMLEEMIEIPTKSQGLMVNLSTSYIHYHFFELDEKFSDKTSERKMLFWKLKNKVPFIKESDILFDYFKTGDKSYVMFTLDKDVLEGIYIYLPKNKEYIINTEIMGIYNYYVYLFNNDKTQKNENVILINMGETITDLIFIEDKTLKFIRSFEIGINEYIKRIKPGSHNLIDGLSLIFSNTYVPQSIEEFLDEKKVENFNKIKDINNSWMKEIDESIKFYIPDNKRSKFKMVFMRYENLIKNLDFVLSNYTNLTVLKPDIQRTDVPFLSLLGNIIKQNTLPFSLK